MKIHYNMLQYKSFTYSFLLPLLFLLASSLPGQTMDNVIDGGYIKNWLLIGPFPMKTFDASLPFPLLSISTAPPHQGMTIQYNQSRKTSWESLSTLSSFINLNSFYGKNEDCYAIAYCTVTAPQEGLYNLFIGQDDMLAVWLNGESVYLSNIDQSLALDKNVVQCWMEQGKNQLLLKSGQGKGFWNFSLRFQESSQNFQPVLSITPDAANTDVWGAFWKYNYGDDPRWASPDYDDSHWATSPSWDFQPNPDTTPSTDSLWIRFQLAFPDQEEQHAYLLSMLPGDIRVFQDGRPTHKNETHIPFVIQFPSFQSPNSWLIHPAKGQTSTIAIQAKNQYNLKMQIHDFMDYHARFSQYLQYHTLILILFTAIPFCLLLFHISIHAFYPGEKYNLIYSLYLISFTAYVLINLQYDNPYIYYDDSSWFHFFKHFIIWPNVCLYFATLYSLFKEEAPPFFYVFIIVLGCLCIFQWYARTDYLFWYVILFLAVPSVSTYLETPPLVN
jgi:hypothetical protein